MKRLLVVLVCGLTLAAQTQIDWNTQIRNIPGHVQNAAGGTSTSVGFVPQYGNAAGTQLTAGLPVATVPTPNALVETGGTGTIAATLVSILNQSTTGNAATATALAAQPVQCTPPMFALGVAPNGNANCGTPATGVTGTPTTVGFVPQYGNVAGTQLTAGLPVAMVPTPNALVLTGGAGTIAATLIPTLNQSTTGNAATATTATALAVTPTNCTTPMFALGITANGTANCGTPAGGGGSVFTGSTAVTSTFSATPTFSLADIAPTKSPVRFEPGQLTANVTSVTFTNTTAGAKFSIKWVQGTAGGFTVNYGTSVNTGNLCQISPTANVWTEQFFVVESDGTSIDAITCSTNELPFAILDAPERVAPPTAGAGLASLWPDPMRHTWTSSQNGSTNQYIMPRCAGVTDQCASTDLSDTTNIAYLDGNPNNFTGQNNFVGAAQFSGGLFVSVTNPGCMQANAVGLLASTGSPCGGAVNVNGGAVTAPNFNATTPAAVPPNIPVTWRASGSSVSAQVAAVGAQAGSQPPCSATTRNYMWFLQGGTGMADLFQICMKSNTDTYSWITVSLP
jgi:hypothetical protein